MNSGTSTYTELEALLLPNSQTFSLPSNKEKRFASFVSDGVICNGIGLRNRSSTGCSCSHGLNYRSSKPTASCALKACRRVGDRNVPHSPVDEALQSTTAASSPYLSIPPLYVCAISLKAKGNNSGRSIHAHLKIQLSASLISSKVP